MSNYDPATNYGSSSPSAGGRPGQAPNGLSSSWSKALIVADSRRTATSAIGTPDLVKFPTVDVQQGEIKTVGQMLLEFDTAQSDPLAVAQLQTILWHGRFYGSMKKPTFTPGVKDDVTRAAFVRALKGSARQQVPFDQFVDTRAQASIAAGMGDGTGTVTTRVIHHAAAQDVEAGALTGFQKAIGRGPTDAESAAFLAGYRQRETAARPDTSGGGMFNVTDAGDPSTAAEAFATKADPKAAEGNAHLAQFNTMLQALGVQ